MTVVIVYIFYWKTLSDLKRINPKPIITLCVHMVVLNTNLSKQKKVLIHETAEESILKNSTENVLYLTILCSAGIKAN